MYRSFLLAVALLAIPAGISPGRGGPPEPTSASATQPVVDEQLWKGHYSQIPQGTDSHGRGVWAFAQYYLAPSKAMVEAAKAAHEGGDLWGTLVLLRCHREGLAVRREERLMHRLNFELRRRLLAHSHPSPLDLYMLSETKIGNEEGIVTVKDPGQEPRPSDEDAHRRWEWLMQAGEAGFAQACDEIGQSYQREEEYEKAYRWYERAARSGLASGACGCT